MLCLGNQPLIALKCYAKVLRLLLGSTHDERTLFTALKLNTTETLPLQAVTMRMAHSDLFLPPII